MLMGRSELHRSGGPSHLRGMIYPVLASPSDAPAPDFVLSYSPAGMAASCLRCLRFPATSRTGCFSSSDILIVSKGRLQPRGDFCGFHHGVHARTWRSYLAKLLNLFGRRKAGFFPQALECADDYSMIR
jgi:hypothetical protein